MKIFSWVHRKLNQKDGLFDRNVKKNEVIIISDENIGDEQHLLQDDSMAHLLGSGWKGGILTIGTFGFDDPLLKDQLSTGLDNDIEDHEKCEIIKVSDHEEPNSLMYPENGHEIISHDEAPMTNVITGNAVPVARRNDDDESNKGSKKGRITLADLFSADQLSDEENVQLPDLYDVTNINKKALKLPQVKNGVSFAKKIIPRVKEDSRCILKLQKLMTRALKKKVHPDMESKNHKNSRVIAAASTMLELSPVTSESVSLLQILETTA